MPPALIKELGLDKIGIMPSDPKAIEEENEQLKLLLAEKELELKLVKEMLKKKGLL